MKAKNIFTELIIRKPKFTLNKQVLDFSKSSVAEIFKKIDTAIYISSKSLYDRLVQYDTLDLNEQSKLAIALFKYYSRMCTRTTPFGFSAGIGMTCWGDFQPLKNQVNNFSLNFSLDGEVLNAIFSALISNNQVLEIAKLYRNDTFSIKENRISLMEREYSTPASVIYSINQFLIQDEDPILKIYDFVEDGKNSMEVIEMLCVYGVSIEDARNFVTTLIQRNILTTSLDPFPNTKKYFDFLLTQLDSLDIEIVEALKKVSIKIKELDLKSEVKVADLRNLEDIIKSYFPKTQKLKNILKVDMNGMATEERVSRNLKKTIQEVFSVIGHFKQSNTSSDLSRFKSNFVDRFGDNYIPLLELFSGDTGFIYAENISKFETPLIDGFSPDAQQESHTYSISQIDNYLLQKYLKFSNLKDHEIVIDDIEIMNIEESHGPSSGIFQVMFSAIDDKLIKLTNVKSNAGSLIARFDDNKKIKDLLSKIVEQESQEYENKIIAEIIHVPDETRSMNVLGNTEVRDFHIPILNNEFQSLNMNKIYLRDLLITVRDNEVILYSKKLDKEIIPRFTSAFISSRFSNVPIYRLLCDIALEKTERYSFNWPGLLYALNPNYLPKVRYKNVVLSDSIWLIYESDFNCELKDDAFWKKLIAFRQRWEVPQLVYLKDGDNKLFLNLENKFIVCNILRSQLRQRKIIELEPYPFTQNGYAENEILSFAKIANENELTEEVPSKIYECDTFLFPPFLGEWLSFHVYSSEKKIEDLLISNQFKNTINRLKETRTISKWFFVRYYDLKGFHLRIRFKCSKGYGNLIEEIIELWKFFGIKEYNIVPYRREVHRYKGRLISESESIFFRQSELIINVLRHLSEVNQEDRRWLIALLLIDLTLNQFGFSTSVKKEFTESLKESFNKEFGIKKGTFKKINSIYKVNRTSIKSLLNDKHDEVFDSLTNEFVSCTRSLFEKIRSIENQKSQLDLARSYIHMFLNKLFIKYPREQESHVYNLSNLYYKEQLYKKKSKVNQGC